MIPGRLFPGSIVPLLGHLQHPAFKVVDLMGEAVAGLPLAHLLLAIGVRGGRPADKPKREHTGHKPTACLDGQGFGH